MGEEETAESEVSEGRDFVEEERALRLAKLDALRERGITPYPVNFRRDHTVGELLERFAGIPPDEETGEKVRIAGRLMTIRNHGGVVFADLKDQTGTVQVAFEKDRLDGTAFADAESLDRGDWVGIGGGVIASHSGTLTVTADSLELLSKALRALPDKHKGLTDVDTRLRERYLDLIANPEARPIFDIRSKVIASVRKTLTDEGFTEVETPVLASQVGGAAARPFITHHNSLDIEMYLRIALELPLKRLVVGGFERVFEIGRVFRNEGLDTRHNPEFTLLEAYQALGDYHDMMDLTEKICSQATIDAIGRTVVKVDGQDVDLKAPWKRITMADLIKETTGETMHPSMPIEDARAICDRLEIHYEDSWGSGRLMSEVYDEEGEKTLLQPTMVCDYPREVSPLAKVHRDDPELTERFEVVVAGRELANAYSELNDPVDQRARFEDEAKAKVAGDEEAESVDDDYIRALEYGLPPTGGLGIGLDRLIMLVSEQSAIREVILFPAMRPEDGDAGTGPPPGADLPTAGEMSNRSTPGPPEPAPVRDEPAETRPAAEPAPVPVAAAYAPPAAEPNRTAQKFLGWMTALAGFVYLLAVMPGVHSNLGLGSLINDVTGRVSGHVVSAVVGLILLMIAGGIAKGKRRAWGVAVLLFAIAAAVHTMKGPDPIVAIYSGFMVIALVWTRDSFGARPDPGTLLDAIRFVPLYLAAVFVFGFASLLFNQNHVVERLTVGGMFETTIAGLAGFDGPYHYTGRFFSDFFPAALFALGIAGLVLLAFLIFRAVALRSGPSAGDRERAEELVHKYGSGTLDYFALRSDKSYFFTQRGDAMIAFTYISGYALVAADPIGAPGSKDRVLDQFLAYCRDRNWKVAFLAVREVDLPIYEKRGLKGVYMGDEAIIPCDRFSLQGSGMKGLRSTVKRVSRELTFRMIRESEATPILCGQLNEIRDRWRGDSDERGFTMDLGTEVEGVNPDFLLAIAYDRDEVPQGFLRLVPVFGEDPGWSLDLMQRNPDAPNGITEFLIANCATTLGRQGFRRLSMNFAAWGRLFDDETSLNLGQKLLKRLAEMLNPFFQIKSLRDFNAKFDPDWWPRSIVVEDVESAPKVGLLYATTEGFLKIPLIGDKLVPPLRAQSPED
ncbi:MAG TPA: lysine--tRNA ligase [Solirubrobacterales bacterium]|nr:lysine--tRNA ligase [Solirubrobacterales bacterium]